MKYLFLLLLLPLISCGPGTTEINHSGICDGYTDPASSDYVLPYPTPEKHEVTQGNCHSISHYGSQQYAYDFAMDIGDDIIAARAGTVLEVEESNEDGNGCPDDNHVYIKHSDGTIAMYVHLTKDGATVAKGAAVNQGDVIAKAGNTGCSSGSHLHFVVFKDESYKESLPVTFSNASSEKRGLRKGQTYTAN